MAGLGETPENFPSHDTWVCRRDLKSPIDTTRSICLSALPGQEGGRQPFIEASECRRTRDTTWPLYGGGDGEFRDAGPGWADPVLSAPLLFRKNTRGPRGGRKGRPSHDGRHLRRVGRFSSSRVTNPQPCEKFASTSWLRASLSTIPESLVVASGRWKQSSVAFFIPFSPDHLSPLDFWSGSALKLSMQKSSRKPELLGC